MAYDPYKAAEEIVRNKGRWSTAVASGKSGDAYHERALYYYDELRKNGYSAVADKLENSDYVEALAYLDTLEKSSGDYDAKKELADASSEKEALKNKQNALYDELRSEYGELYESVKSDGLSSYGEEIFERYRKAGEAAAGHAVAENAATNGGNINSYAAANAHRQLNSYLTAGAEAAEKAESERTDRLISVLDAMYTTGKGLLDSQNSAINDKADTASKVYGDELDSKTAERNNELELQISREERDGAWQKIDEDDLYIDRYDKYFDALIKLYPQYSDEINDIFHFLG